MASSEHFSIFVIGETGNGKSQFCAYLSDDKSAFHPSDGVDSYTQLVSSKRVKRFGYDFTVYDNPGLNDKKKDANSKHIKEMVTSLRGVKDCKAFIIVLNPHQPRFTASTQETVEYFRDIFGPGIVSNLFLVWTKADERKAKSWRTKKQAEFTKQVADLFGEVQGHIPSFYVNSKPEDDEYEYAEEFQIKELQKLLQAASLNKYYDCSSAKIVATKQEQLETAKQEKEKATLEKQKAEKDAERERRAKERAQEEAQRATESAKQAAEDAKRAKQEAIEIQKQVDQKAREIEDLKKRPAESKTLDLLPLLAALTFANSTKCDPSPTPMPYPMMPMPMGYGGYGGGVDEFSCTPSPRRPFAGPHGAYQEKFYKGGQFLPGGGRAPKGGTTVHVPKK